MLNLVNERRLQSSLPPLTSDPILIQAASQHAQDLANATPNAPNIAMLLEQHQFPYMMLADDVAFNGQTEQDTMNQLVASKRHLAPMLLSNVTLFGSARADASTGVPYYVLVFASVNTTHEQLQQQQQQQGEYFTWTFKGSNLTVTGAPRPVMVQLLHVLQQYEAKP